MQAQLFVTQEPSELLEDLIERLGVLRVAAEVREDRVQRAHSEDSVPSVVVSESSQEEFDAMERSWVGTIPQVLTPPERS